MSGTVRVKKEQKKTLFARKEAKMSFWCYFSAKKIISMKKKFHDPFINPYRPRTIYIWFTKAENTTCRYDVISLLFQIWFHHLTTFSTSTLNLKSNGRNFSPISPILKKLWQFEFFKFLYFFSSKYLIFKNVWDCKG